MDLILWRHAEAEEGLAGEPDSLRALTPRGEKQARRMAQWLDRQLPQSARIWVSPAVRTQQTANALARAYKLRPELAPGASAADLLALIDLTPARSPLLLVGHQPTLGQLIAQLLGVASGEMSVKKGAVWWLRHRHREQGDQTVLHAVQAPDML